MSDPVLNRANTKSALSQCFQYLLTQGDLSTILPIYKPFITGFNISSYTVLYCMKSLSHFRIPVYPFRILQCYYILDD